MIEGIPLGLGDLGLGGLLVFAVAIPMLMLYRRKLVPEKDLLDQQKEKADWRAAHERSEEARKEMAEQLRELISAVAEANKHAELSVAALEALRDRAHE